MAANFVTKVTNTLLGTTDTWDRNNAPANTANNDVKIGDVNSDQLLSARTHWMQHALKPIRYLKPLRYLIPLIYRTRQPYIYIYISIHQNINISIYPCIDTSYPYIHRWDPWNTCNPWDTLNPWYTFHTRYIIYIHIFIYPCIDTSYPYIHRWDPWNTSNP